MTESRTQPRQGPFAEWLAELRASHRAFLAVEARILAVKRARPITMFEARFYQALTGGVALLAMLMILGAR